MSKWPLHSLEQLIHIKHGFAFKGEYFTDEITSTIVVTPGNFAIGGGFQNSKPKWYDTTGPKPEEYILHPKDLIVTMTDLSKDADTLGYSAFVPKDQYTYLHNQRIGLVKVVEPQLLNKEYLYFAMRSRIYREQIVATASGSTVHHTSPDRIRAAKIPIPPLPIQHRIATILGRLDDKIEVNRRINRTLEAMAQALYRHWFVDFGPFQAGAFVESALGLIPVGWTTTTLEKITAKIGSGATPRGGSSVYIDEGINLIRSQNVYDSAFSWDGLAHITDDAAEKLRTVTVEAGDVLINITGDSILRTCVADEAVLPARVNQHVAIIRPIAEVPPHFVHQHLLRPETKEMLFNMSAGATRKAITKGNLEDTPILLPPTRVLDKFRCKTDSFFARIAVNNRESRKLAEIRDYLLPKLLAGEVESHTLHVEIDSLTS